MTQKLLLAFTVPTALSQGHAELSAALTEQFGIAPVTDLCVTHIPITPSFYITGDQYVLMEQLLGNQHKVGDPKTASLGVAAQSEEDECAIILSTRLGPKVSRIITAIHKWFDETDVVSLDEQVKPEITLARFRRKPNKQMLSKVLKVAQNWQSFPPKIAIDEIVLFKEKGGLWERAAFYELTQQ